MKNNIKKVIGSKIIVERFKFAERSKSGLFLPVAISNDKNEVGSILETAKYQNRGRVIAVGNDVTHIEVNDIVIFDPRSTVPLMSDPSDLSELASLISGEIQSDFVQIDEYSVIYVETPQGTQQDTPQE